MINVNNLLNNVIREAIDIKIPISDQIEKEVIIDKGRHDRVGACYRYIYPKRYVIHLSQDTLNGSKHMIKSIIAHEILHTCLFCSEHGYLWSSYKDKMNNHYNYNIKEKYLWSEVLEK